MLPNKPFQLGLLGYPLGHTLSPLLHQWLLSHTGVEGNYSAYAIPPERFDDSVSELLREGQMDGLNVTIPYKVKVMPLLDALSPTAKLVGAVNTIHNTADNDALPQWTGENTDISGFYQSLPKAIRQHLPKTRVLVLGAGGAARAVLAALVEYHAAHIAVAFRKPNQQEVLSVLFRDLQAHYKTQIPVQYLDWQPDTQKPLNIADYQLIINTTPIGMAPNLNESPLTDEALRTLAPNAFLYDLVYNPLETFLIQQAKRLNLPHQGGLDMLIYQAIHAFQLWTHQTLSLTQQDLANLRQHLTQQFSPPMEVRK
jgi:shikimate dehydrogenase